MVNRKDFRPYDNTVSKGISDKDRATIKKNNNSNNDTKLSNAIKKVEEDIEAKQKVSNEQKQIEKTKIDNDPKKQLDGNGNPKRFKYTDVNHNSWYFRTEGEREAYENKIRYNLFDRRFYESGWESRETL